MVPNTFFAKTFRFDFPALKMMQILPRHLMPLLLPKVYNDEPFRPEFHGGFPLSYDLTFAFGYGVEGVRDTTHWADNVQAFYPHSRVSSKFSEHGEIGLPEDYQAFFDKHENVVLIAFGTTFMPSDEDMMNLFEMVKLADPTKLGFIISLKEHLTSF